MKTKNYSNYTVRVLDKSTNLVTDYLIRAEDRSDAKRRALRGAVQAILEISPQAKTKNKTIITEIFSRTTRRFKITFITESLSN